MATRVNDNDLRRAQNIAAASVDDVEGQTFQHIVEVFGARHDHPAEDGSGETWGSLFVVADGELTLFEEQRAAVGETCQTIDSYGYPYGTRCVCGYIGENVTDLNEHMVAAAMADDNDHAVDV